MFEIKAGDKTNENLIAAFIAIGYRPFRLLAGAPILVPVAAGDVHDAYELNLFAAKPDRIKSLKEQNVLVDEIPAWAPDEEMVRNAMSLLKAQAFAPIFHAGGQLDPDYARVLAAYAVWRTNDLPAVTRSVALGFAYHRLAALCQRAPTNARISTYARIAWEMGGRNECVRTLQVLSENLKRDPFNPSEPFWPVCARYDAIPPGADAERWFIMAVAEQLERARTYSTTFGGGSAVVNWLCSQPLAAVEMERRRILIAARAGERPAVPARLCQPAPDHLNAEVWRAGKVPGMVVGP
jgi:hypothetical protein